MTDSDDRPTVHAASRLAIEAVSEIDDIWVSRSPRSGGHCAEGPWCQWVHLARLILADDRTRVQMPAHYAPYAHPDLHTGHHPDCQAQSPQVPS